MSLFKKLSSCMMEPLNFSKQAWELYMGYIEMEKEPLSRYLSLKRVGNIFAA